MRRNRSILIPTEHQSQSAFFDWWAICAVAKGIHESLCFAVPNGAHLAGDARQRAIQMKRLKSAGLKTGVPDVWLAIARHGFHALVMEFKRKGEKPTGDQEEMLYHLRRGGYNALVVWSTEDAIQAVEAYLQ